MNSITIEEFVANIDKYCWASNIVISNVNSCEELVALLKKYGGVYYTDEPAGHVALCAKDTLVVFVEMTCGGEGVEIGRLWCWKRLN